MNKYAILGIIFLIVIMATSGCATPQVPFFVMHTQIQPKLDTELINTTVLSGLGGYNSIDLPAGGGIYHIHAETTRRDGDFTVGYMYRQNNKIYDRFGSKDNFVQSHALIGNSDSTQIVDTTITIPDDAIEPELAIFIHNDDGGLNIAVERMNNAGGSS
jgi:hypothetical protein